MRGQGTVYVLGFATSVCVVCSLAIAGTALGLRPLQNVNIEIDKKKNVLAAAGLVVSKDKVLETFEAKVRAKVVDLEAGTLSDKSMADLNEKQLAADVYKMTPEEAKYRPVYLVGEGSSEVTIVPIAGKGLWSTVYGFLALQKDRNTIKGVTFYKHGETPGLGGECDKEWFTSNFVGKTMRNAKGEISFGVAKSKASKPSCQRFGGVDHCVDGMSGATITSNGITELMQRAMRDYSGFFAAKGG